MAHSKSSLAQTYCKIFLAQNFRFLIIPFTENKAEECDLEEKSTLLLFFTSTGEVNNILSIYLSASRKSPSIRHTTSVTDVC